MKLAKKIIWAEGTLLAQQHFQQWENYLLQQQRTQFKTIAPLNWGIQKIQIDAEALQNNQFRLYELQGIFPNGELITLQQPLSCEIPEHSSETVAIFICLPNNQQVTGIPGYPGHANPAWKAQHHSTTDLYDTNRQSELLLAEANITLVTNPDALENYTYIKIAELIFTQNHWQTKPQFIPALVTLQGSDYLKNLLALWADLILGKIRVLNERRGQFKGNITEFGQNDLQHFLLLQQFNNIYPLLQHQQLHPHTHPETLFLQMLGFISNLSTFAENSIMAQLPTYQHHNLSNSFAQLNKLLRELLEAVMPVRLQPLQLRREHDSLYVIDTIEASALQNTQLFLAVFLQAENTEWIAQFAKQIKVGTVATIDSIVTSALPGVKLTHMQRPPVRLPIKTGYEYFYIEPTGQFWEQIKIERTLAVFLPDHFTQATIELARIEE